jgi:hypothetical protein
LSKNQSNDCQVELKILFFDYNKNPIENFYINKNGFLYTGIFKLAPIVSDFSFASKGDVFYRQVMDPASLNVIQAIINSQGQYNSSNLVWALIVTWSNVSAGNCSECLNNFQVIVASTSASVCDLFVVFLYKGLSIPLELRSKVFAGFMFPFLSKDIGVLLENPALMPQAFVYKVDDNVISACVSDKKK